MWFTLNVLAIFDAAFVSSTLFANLMDKASISVSGFIFCNKDKTNVESTPPLNAIQTFWSSNDFKFCSILLEIDFSIKSTSGVCCLDLKSWEFFF